MIFFDKIILLTESLLNKWGFSDGDVLDEFVDLHLPEFEKILREEIQKDVLPKDSRTLLFHGNLLEILVRKYMLPTMPYKLVLQRFVGHNPVRAKSIDGIPIKDHLNPPQIKLEPEIIEIPQNEVIQELLRLWHDSQYLYEVRQQYPDASE